MSTRKLPCVFLSVTGSGWRRLNSFCFDECRIDLTAFVTLPTEQLFEGMPLPKQFGNALSFKALPEETLASFGNRLLRWDTTFQKEMTYKIRLIQKSLVTPVVNKLSPAAITLGTLDRLCQWVITLSRTAHLESPPLNALELKIVLTPSDYWLALSHCYNLAQQYQLDQLVKQEFSYFKHHQRACLPAHYYEFPSQPGISIRYCSDILAEQGLNTQWIDLTSSSDLDPNQADQHIFWQFTLCRQLSQVLPWSLIPHQTLNAPMGKPQFPYLYWYQAWISTISTHAKQPQCKTPPSLLSPIPGIRLDEVDAWFAPLIEKNRTAISETTKLSCPIQRFVMVEGNTEQLLLPAIAKQLGYAFHSMGVHVEAMGGKNRMLQDYREYSELLAIPIVVILDADAAPIAQELALLKRPQDIIYVLPTGEFEDLYPPDWITTTLMDQGLSESETLSDLIKQAEVFDKQVKKLDFLYQALSLGSFDKVPFALLLIDSIQKHGLSCQAFEPLIQTIIVSHQSSFTR